MLIHQQLNIFSVRIPLRAQAGFTNCYAIKGAYGWTLIDAGVSTPAGILAWQKFMNEHGITPENITAIYITHGHLDHAALAGWFQSQVQVPAFITRQDIEVVDRFWYGYRAQLKVLFRINGMKQEVLDLIKPEEKPNVTGDWIKPVLTELAPDTTVWLGDHAYRVIFTPGHSDGHVCFWNDTYGVLLCGDHVLSGIAPNIGMWPGSNYDPLGAYLKSLEQNLSLDCKLALTAHGNTIVDFAQRVGELVKLHHQQLELIKNSLKQEMTAYDVLPLVFGTNLEFGSMQLGFMAIIAYMQRLRIMGEVKISQRVGVEYYSRS